MDLKKIHTCAGICPLIKDSIDYNLTLIQFTLFAWCTLPSLMPAELLLVHSDSFSPGAFTDVFCKEDRVDLSAAYFLSSLRFNQFFTCKKKKNRSVTLQHCIHLSGMFLVLGDTTTALCHLGKFRWSHHQQFQINQNIYFKVGTHEMSTYKIS